MILAAHFIDFDPENPTVVEVLREMGSDRRYRYVPAGISVRSLEPGQDLQVVSLNDDTSPQKESSTETVEDLSAPGNTYLYVHLTSGKRLRITQKSVKLMTTGPK